MIHTFQEATDDNIYAGNVKILISGFGSPSNVAYIATFHTNVVS
jgi:hypothetical protein